MILKATPIVEQIDDFITTKIKGNAIPKLTLVSNTDDGGVMAYGQSIQRMANKYGIMVNWVSMPKYKASTSIITELIGKSDAVLPLMPFTCESFYIDTILESIKPIQDIDALGYVKSEYNPCTAESCIRMLDYYNIDLKGKHIVVIGRSDVIGKPVSLLALEKNATVTICHSKTPDIAKFTKEADVVISAAGKPHLIEGPMLKDNSTILDVGTSYVNGKLYGDVDYDTLNETINYSTTKDGIGRLTTMILLEHTVKSYLEIEKEKRNESYWGC